MNEPLSFWEAVLILIFLTAPLLRLHALFVLRRVRKASKLLPLSEVGASGEGVLAERYLVALTGAIGSVLVGLLGINRLFPFIPEGLTLMIFSAALIMFTIPAAIWEWMYLTGRLEK